MSKLTCTVIMTTYNGEKYIYEQLESIRNQTHKPDEVIIVDDCSSDKTVEILYEYIEKYNLINWKILVNKNNVGWKANFIYGFRKCKTDIIFPCDQDDIWYLDKIENMINIFKDSNINVVAGNAKKIFSSNSDYKLNVSSTLDKLDSKFDSIRKTGLCKKYRFDKSFFYRKPGCVLAIRNDFFKTVDYIGIENFAHDSLIPYFAKLTDSYFILDTDVILWRRHIDSTSRTTNMNRRLRINELLNDRNMLSEIIQFIRINDVSEDKVKIVKKSIKWNNYRMNLLNKHYLYAIPLLLYLSFYRRKRRFLSDLKYALESGVILENK